MKQSAFLSITTLGTLAISLLIVAPVFAETHVEVSNNGEGATSNVNVHTSTGSNTVCINGKCTTSGGNTGQSTVCINGKCTTSSDGNINMQSDDGHSKVNINNNSGNSSVNVSQNSSGSVSNDVHVDTNTGGKHVEGVNVAPTVAQKKKEIKQKMEEKKQQIIQHHTNPAGFNLWEFLKHIFGF